MRIPSIRYFVLFSLPLLLTLHLSGAVAADTTGTSQYTALKQLYSNPSEKNAEAIRTYLTQLPTPELFQLAKGASANKDSTVLSILIGGEIVYRLRSGSISASRLLDEIESSLPDNYYHKCFLFWVLGSSPQQYSAEDKKRIFVATRQYIDKAKSPFLGQRLAAIVTSNSMLAWLVADGQADTRIVSDYGNQLLALASDWSEGPVIRRAAVKGIEEIKFREAIPTLLQLLSDSKTLTNPPLARALCTSLARFDSKEAIDRVGYILENTADEYTFGCAATTLGHLGGESALRFLVNNAKRFQGGFVGAAISGLDTLVLELLSSGGNGSLATAVLASRYLYRSEDVPQCKTLLLDRLYSTSNKNVIRLILNRLTQIVAPDEAESIVKKVPYDSVYAQEWEWLNRLARSNIMPSSLSSVPVDENRETGGQEYGDAAYKKLGYPVISGLGHAGLYAGIDSEDSLRIIEIGMTTEQCQDNLLLLLDVIHHNYWYGMVEDPDFWGVYTLSNESLTFEDRQSIMETAWTLEGYDIVGYPLFYYPLDDCQNKPIWDPWPDALNYYPNAGSTITPNEIERLRCDGLVEYSYEYNGHSVWGKNGANYDISQTANVEEHNVFYDIILGGDPNTQLAPVVQCGRAGGYSTYMTRAAIDEVDLPTYRVRYTQVGSTVYVRIKATDKSGIHYIKLKHGDQGNWVISDIQDQHPTSDNYECEFPIYNMTQSGYIYFYAKDNGGNYPQYAEQAWIDVCQGNPNRPVLVSPANGATGVSQAVCLDWQDTPGATEYVVQYGLEGQMYWDDPVISDPAVSYYCPPALQPGKHYWWRVRVWTDCGHSDWTDTSWFTTTCNQISPPVPYTLDPDNKLCPYTGSYNIWWHPVPGASGYLYKCTEVFGDTWWPWNKHWDDTVVSAWRCDEYTMRLKAYSDCDTSSESQIVLHGLCQPNPVNLNSPDSGATGVNQPVVLDWSDGTLSWPGAYAEYYEVQIDTLNSFISADTIMRLESDFAAAGLVPGKEYFWRVRACNRCYYRSYWSNTWSFIASCPALSAPNSSTLSPPDGSSGGLEVNFAWGEVENALAYAIRIDTLFSGPQYEWYYDTVNVNGITLSIPPKQIYWQVKTLGSPNCESSDWTSPVSYTDVEEIPSVLPPSIFYLSQNYPNPFNAETQIRFSLPKDAFVTIEVYNMLGHRVRTLLSEQLPIGYKEVIWNGRDEEGRNVASGIYFYKIKAGNFAESKRMVLVK